MTDFKLDGTDKKIIKMLQNNSRVHVSEIARKIGNMTENAIRYRIDKLESEGFISTYTIRLNRKKFGKDITAIFNLNVLPENINRAVDLLKTMDSLTEIYLTTGTYSITAIGYFQDRNELTKFITQNLKKIKMIDYDVITVLDRIKHELYAI
ncbi:MAG: Lrp/AsnC family transcriptional regulator [Thermoplasmata archaeon]|nr:MAG: Lrp/AsnC family transcriptional regulator [Thermoplasmata archaeon]